METLAAHLQSTLSKRGTYALMLRHAESLCNMAGSLSGWTDNKLSDYGKKQAQELYFAWHRQLPLLKGHFCSDLARAIQTSQISSVHSIPFTSDERLRECYFGEAEGEHYDTLKEEAKRQIVSPDYVAPKGEGWEQVYKRTLDFFEDRLTDDGVYLCVSHGGLICRLTYYIGLENALPNASIACVKLEQRKPTSIEFIWKMPDLTK